MAPTAHHMSMPVVCVAVPSSSSGARYLPTEAHHLVSSRGPTGRGGPAPAWEPETAWVMQLLTPT